MGVNTRRISPIATQMASAARAAVHQRTATLPMILLAMVMLTTPSRHPGQPWNRARWALSLSCNLRYALHHGEADMVVLGVIGPFFCWL